MNKNVSTATKYLKKEIERLEKEATTWQLKESVAHENYENTIKRIGTGVRKRILESNLYNGRLLYCLFYINFSR